MYEPLWQAQEGKGSFKLKKTCAATPQTKA
jgi:hypothetical protein